MRTIIITSLIGLFLFSGVFVAHAQFLIPNPIINMGIEVGKSVAENGVSGTVEKAKDLASDPLGTLAKGAGSVMFGSFELKAMGKLLWGLNYVIAFIGSILFTLAAFLVQIGIYFNATILDTAIVKLGWQIMRDLANLGFTIGIVVIAYMTILGIEEYSIKKNLMWLIIAAVLVNFSFSVAGVLIDVSNIVTHFFVSKSIAGSNGGGALPFSSATGPNISIEGWQNSGAGELAETLADAFGPQRLLVVNENNSDEFAQISSNAGIIMMVVATFFIALFTIIASLGMLAVGWATLWRFIVLSGLIIVMPGAILTWGFSSTGAGKWWKDWKNEFVNQLIHLPIIAFFLYITILFIKIQGTAAASGQLSIKDVSALSSASVDKILGIMANPLQIMVEMMLLLGLLFWGLTQSRKWSAYGGGAIIDRIEGIGNWMISAGGYKGAGAREWATRKALTMGPEPDKNLGNQLANVAAKIPFAGGLVNSLRNVAGADPSKANGWAKEYGSYTKDQRLSKLRNPELSIDQEKMAGMAKSLAEKGDFSSDPAKGATMAEFEKLIPAAKRFGFEEEILKVAPHLYKDFNMDETKLTKFIDKNIKAEDMEKISADALKNPYVVMRLNALHFKRLQGKEKEDHRKNFINTLTNTMTENSAREFMKSAFEKPKDIEEIHPEILKSERFITGLNTGHMDYLHKNPPGTQEQRIILEGLATTLKNEQEKSKNFVFDTDYEKLNTIKSLAKTILEKGEAPGGWLNAQQDPETMAVYKKLKEVYELPTSSINPKIEQAKWNIETRKKDIEQLRIENESRPTVIKSAEDALKRSEREYLKITEQIKRQQNKPK